jgi:glycosyltransferase involved in cell wall biosynthesis
VPLVSVLLAVRDGAAYLREAVASVLFQSLQDLELVVVDDASTDASADVLASFEDPRLTVLRNEEQQGLARSLNLALDRAQGEWVARLDADDVALPLRLETQLEKARAEGLGIVGSAILELDAVGSPGRFHAMPRTPQEVRWHGLFSSPFFHPSVLVDRGLLEEHGLCYDVDYAESEDYDLWMRLLQHAEGANTAEPLVLYRIHERQATRRRRHLQRDFQREVALREIAAVAPELTPEEAEGAWLLGSSEGAGSAEAFERLLEAFEARHGRGDEVREAAARTLARAGERKRALALVPTLPTDVALTRARRAAFARDARRDAREALQDLDPSTPERVRVTYVAPEPTPFRSIMFDRIAQRPELDFRVVYSGHTIFSRWWTIVPEHRAAFMDGRRIPGVRDVFRHDYPITTRIVRELEDSRPDIVVIAGWSTFAAQSAFAWCRARGVPYVLVVESNDADPRPGWRRAVKGAVVPPFVRGAERVLAIGALARESVLARGADPERVSWFANTVDAPWFAEEAERLRERREELRAAMGAGDDDIVVLSIARLAPEKGLDTLVLATATAADPRLLLVLAGDGPERERLEELARSLGVRLRIVENVPFERVVERYVAADVFALLSTHEPWGVVVNEAAACGLPLVLTDRVGAHADLLVPGENGMLVAAGDVQAAGDALRSLAADPELRRRYGERSLELMRGWGYEPSIENFVAAVRAAAAR